MSDGKLFAIVAGMTVVIVLLVALLLHVPFFSAHGSDLLPSQRFDVSLMPGQSEQIANTSYSRFDVSSDYPVSVRVGACYYPRVVTVHIECSASDVIVTDTRPALLVWAHVNRIQIVAR